MRSYDNYLESMGRHIDGGDVEDQYKDLISLVIDRIALLLAREDYDGLDSLINNMKELVEWAKNWH